MHQLTHLRPMTRWSMLGGLILPRRTPRRRLCGMAQSSYRRWAFTLWYRHFIIIMTHLCELQSASQVPANLSVCPSVRFLKMLETLSRHQLQLCCDCKPTHLTLENQMINPLNEEAPGTEPANILTSKGLPP